MNNLETWCKQNDKLYLLDEWDYDKNTIYPCNVAAMSNKKYWWRCEKNHEYESSVGGRTSRGRGCPYCNNKKILVGYNDLTTTNPDLAVEFDEIKSGILATAVVAGSGKKVWWKCDKGHSYEAIINRRSIYGDGCPFCSGHRVLKGFNDVATTNPELISEWNDNKISPYECSAGSAMKVNWKCSKCYNEWTAAIEKRVNGRGCPECAKSTRPLERKKTYLKNNGSLKENFPDLIKEWDYEKNDKIGLSPANTLSGTHKKAYWKCIKCGNGWSASIASRTRKNGAVGCPECGKSLAVDNKRKSILEKKGSIVEVAAFILKEWDYEKNTSEPSDFSIGSDYKAWWTCKICGNKWKARISHRVNGIGCPQCKRERSSSFPEQAIFYYLKKYFSDIINGDKHLGCELDIYIPSVSIAIEYDGQAWHKDINRDIEKNSICKNNNIALYRVREKGCPHINDLQGITIYEYDYGDLNALNNIIMSLLNKLDVIQYDVDVSRDTAEIYDQYIRAVRENSLEEKYPNLINEWDYDKNKGVKPSMVSSGTDKIVWWKCKEGHSYKSPVARRVKQIFGCPYCTKRKLLVGFNDFETCHPELLEYWDYDKNEIKPSQLIGGSKRVWWKCNKGHSYEATINNKITHHGGCPICTNYLTVVGINDLFTTNPELIREWDFEKNNNDSPQSFSKVSKNKVWWKCDKGHSYQTAIINRTSKNKTGCPICTNRIVVRGINDLATTNPDIITEWDYNKNEKIKPFEVVAGSNKKVWWKCEKGHSYKTTIISRTGKDKTGCPICANRIVVFGINDLTTTNPDLMLDWDYTKNSISPNSITSGTVKKVWWKCHKCCFEWEASISSRKSGKGCPKCGIVASAKAKCKPIINLDTNQVFDSIKQAEEYYGKGNISKCLRGESKTACGYRWKYV